MTVPRELQHANGSKVLPDLPDVFPRPTVRHVETAARATTPERAHVQPALDLAASRSNAAANNEARAAAEDGIQVQNPESDAHGISIADVYAYMPEHRYMVAPTRDLWPARSVNARLGTVRVGDTEIPASAWLDQHQAVVQMTWAPGEPMLIYDRLIAEGGWVDRKGVAVFNLYRPPRLRPGDAGRAGPWLAHIERVYPESRPHIVAWLAHRVQRPGEKVNHALLLGGPQGIGKDSLLEPVKRAVGPWNFADVSPSHLLGRFNGFVKSVILRVSEARDLGDTNRFAFYDHLKVYTAAPPDVLRVDEKNVREYAVPNVCGVVITTNHKSDGICLPADDRRHYVAWSTLTKEDFTPAYWRELYAWYESGGHGHVAAYLAQFDLSGFDPKAPPPQTPAFWDIVDSNRAPEDAELADALDALGSPAAATLSAIEDRSTSDFSTWLRDRRNSRAVPHRLEAVGYVPVRNPDAKDGRWKVNNRRQVIYARQELSLRDRIEAARAVTEGGGAW